MFSTEPILSTTHTHTNFCASKTRTSLSRELVEKSLTLGRISYLVFLNILLDINCRVRKRAKLKEKIERTREVISGKQRKSRRAFWVRKINRAKAEREK